MSKLKSTLFAVTCLASLASACTTEIDEDAYRAGAIRIEIDEVTNDELYPTAGDEIDWKMVFVPTPGNITVKTFWDHPLEIFNVEVGIYDRFGILIHKESRETGGGTGTVSAFLPESGLHFIKLAADSGRSIYSVNVEFETNYDGFTAPTTAPTFDAYLDFDAEMAAKDKKANDNAAGAAAAPGAAAPLPGAAGGGVALPTAAAGGVALPTAAAGGIMSAGGGFDEGPTVVRGDSGGASWSNSDIKKVDNNAGAVTNKETLKPICSDIRGKYFTLEADVLSVSSLSKGTQFKLDAGKKQGVKAGSVGEIYVDGKLLEGGRFKIDKILDSSVTCVTNAPAKLVKKASKFVIKVPE